MQRLLGELGGNDLLDVLLKVFLVWLIAEEFNFGQPNPFSQVTRGIAPGSGARCSRLARGWRGEPMCVGCATEKPV